MARGGWVYVASRAGDKPPPAEKLAIADACERFMAEVLRPRFLPQVRPDGFNCSVAIRGKWHGNKYRFMTRSRAGNRYIYPAEFDAPFARLDFVGRDFFDLFWHRHTGEWCVLFERLTFAEALHRIENEPYFMPC